LRQQAAAREITDSSSRDSEISASEPAEVKPQPVVVPDHFAKSESDKDQEPLRVILLDEVELRSGESVTLRILVSRAGADRREPARKARVVVKTLGSTFRPTSTMATTNPQGMAVVPILIPSFESGRAAILIQAHIDGETAELRRIIMAAK